MNTSFSRKCTVTFRMQWGKAPFCVCSKRPCRCKLLRDAFFVIVCTLRRSGYMYLYLISAPMLKNGQKANKRWHFWIPGFKTTPNKYLSFRQESRTSFFIVFSLWIEVCFIVLLFSEMYHKDQHIFKRMIHGVMEHTFSFSYCHSLLTIVSWAYLFYSENL